MIDVETLARALHEAGREAVLAGNTVAARNLGDKGTLFLEWDSLDARAQLGRRQQAQWLIERFEISPKRIEEPVPSVDELVVASAEKIGADKPEVVSAQERLAAKQEGTADGQ